MEIKKIITKGIDTILVESDLEKELKSGKKLRVKLLESGVLTTASREKFVKDMDSLASFDSSETLKYRKNKINSDIINLDNQKDTIASEGNVDNLLALWEADKEIFMSRLDESDTIGAFYFWIKNNQTNECIL